MDGRIAQVDAHCASAVLALNAGDSLTGFVQRRFPRNVLPGIAVPALRFADPIWIGLHVRNRSGLWAQMALAKGIIPIAAHATDRCSLHLNRQTANRLAQHARVEVNLLSSALHDPSRMPRADETQERRNRCSISGYFGNNVNGPTKTTFVGDESSTL